MNIMKAFEQSPFQSETKKVFKDEHVTALLRESAVCQLGAVTKRKGTNKKRLKTLAENVITSLSF